VPYLEKGEVISLETMNSLNNDFDGRFLTFAFWFQ
jgi:hypothetical protein